MGSNQTNYTKGSRLVAGLETHAQVFAEINEKYGLSLEENSLSNPFKYKRLKKTPQPLQPEHWPHGYDPRDDGKRLDPVVVQGGQHLVSLIPVRFWHLRHSGPTHALTIAFQNYWFAQNLGVCDPVYEFSPTELDTELRRVRDAIDFLEDYNQSSAVNFYRRQTTEHDVDVMRRTVKDVQKRVATLLDPSIQDQFAETLDALDIVLRELVNYALSLERSLSSTEERSGRPPKYFNRTNLIAALFGTPVVDLWQADSEILAKPNATVGRPLDETHFLDYCLTLRANQLSLRAPFLSKLEIASLLLASGVVPKKPDEPLGTAIHRVANYPVDNRWKKSIRNEYVTH